MPQLFLERPTGRHIFYDDLKNVALVFSWEPATTGANRNGFSITLLPCEFHISKVVRPRRLGAKTRGSSLQVKIARQRQRKDFLFAAVAKHFHNCGIRTEESVFIHTRGRNSVGGIFD